MNVSRPVHVIDFQNLTHWYQPIYRIDTGNILGYEALVRSKSFFELSPLDIFKKAEQEGCRTSLDCQLIFKAINSVNSVNSIKQQNLNILFLNIYPSTLLEEGFLAWWDEHIEVECPLVLEISEGEPVNDWEGLRNVLNELKNRGLKIALDDMGAAYSFFKHWIELQPDYIKLDRYYAIDLAQNELKQHVLESFIKLFNHSAEIILEGVEKIEDMEVAKDLGISYAQGYLFGKPSPMERIIRNEML